MKNFAAIDFETANEERTSVCSVGVVIVKDGEIVDTFYSLIRPVPDHYVFTYIHGLTQSDTDKNRGCAFGKNSRRLYGKGKKISLRCKRRKGFCR